VLEENLGDEGDVEEPADKCKNQPNDSNRSVDVEVGSLVVFFAVILHTETIGFKKNV
jgi:hypothetical protein